ncbi:MAG: hypothetical protein CL785_01370 [Chloroflexi bacterium]|nr:hypothetical protein [Chloroflexota bacterium]
MILIQKGKKFMSLIFIFRISALILITFSLFGTVRDFPMIWLILSYGLGLLFYGFSIYLRSK